MRRNVIATLVGVVEDTGSLVVVQHVNVVGVVRQVTG
jgi:hypothetical protein